MGKAAIATRKKGVKRRKASAKQALKTAAKRTTSKKAKSKVHRAGRVARTSVTKKQRPRKAAVVEASRDALNQVTEVRVEETIIDVIEEPVPGAIDVTEAKTIETENSAAASTSLS